MSLYCFSKTQRLGNATDFKEVFDDAQFKVHQPNLLVLAKFNQLAHSRLGLVVAKKKVRRAHERNRIKRLARERFRLSQQWAYSLDIVVMPKVGIEVVSNAELVKQFDALWSKLQYLAKKQSPPLC